MYIYIYVCISSDIMEHVIFKILHECCVHPFTNASVESCGVSSENGGTPDYRWMVSGKISAWNGWWLGVAPLMETMLFPVKPRNDSCEMMSSGQIIPVSSWKQEHFGDDTWWYPIPSMVKCSRANPFSLKAMYPPAIPGFVNGSGLGGSYARGIGFSWIFQQKVLDSLPGCHWLWCDSFRGIGTYAFRPPLGEVMVLEADRWLQVSHFWCKHRGNVRTKWVEPGTSIISSQSEWSGSSLL